MHGPGGLSDSLDRLHRELSEREQPSPSSSTMTARMRLANEHFFAKIKHLAPEAYAHELLANNPSKDNEGMPTPQDLRSSAYWMSKTPLRQEPIFESQARVSYTHPDATYRAIGVQTRRYAQSKHENVFERRRNW